jgi:hypothetical protein
MVFKCVAETRNKGGLRMQDTELVVEAESPDEAYEVIEHHYKHLGLEVCTITLSSTLIPLVRE